MSLPICPRCNVESVLRWVKVKSPVCPNCDDVVWEDAPESDIAKLHELIEKIISKLPPRSKTCWWDYMLPSDEVLPAILAALNGEWTDLEKLSLFDYKEFS